MCAMIHADQLAAIHKHKQQDTAWQRGQAALQVLVNTQNVKEHDVGERLRAARTAVAELTAARTNWV